MSKPRGTKAVLAHSTAVTTAQAKIVQREQKCPWAAHNEAETALEWTKVAKKSLDQGQIGRWFQAQSNADRSLAKAKRLCRGKKKGRK